MEKLQFKRSCLLANPSTSETLPSLSHENFQDDSSKEGTSASHHDGHESDIQGLKNDSQVAEWVAKLPKYNHQYI